jgi:hypothetical protein
MPWFLTEYEPFPVEPVKAPKNNIGKYGTHIWAKNWKHAETVCAMRRIGEIVVGAGHNKRDRRPEPLPSQLLKKRMTHRQRIDFIHAVTFFSYLLMQSTGAPASAIVGDEGLVHQAIHCMIGAFPRQAMKTALEYFERRVPGL